MMLNNYFRVLSRFLWKSKLSSGLNILGLAVGMACFLLVVQYVRFELSYDSFHKSKDDIYRIQRNVYRDNELHIQSAQTTFNLGHALKQEFPEVKEVVRGRPFADNVVIYKEQKYVNEKIYISDPSIFKVFSFQLVQGDPETALEGPNKLLLSESMAKKYFGSENPMGKIIQISTRSKVFSCMVNGVFKDIPENSIFKFNMLLSVNTIWKSDFSDWIYTVFHTYVLLTPGADAKAFEAKFPGFIKKYILKTVPAATNFKYILQPLRDIYLYSDLLYDTENGNGKIVYFLLFISFLIILISWINYVNLSTARAVERSREVGIRKVVGSSRIQLIKQFLAESMLTSMIPIVISVILAAIFIPQLRSITGKNIPLTPGDYWFWIIVLALYLAGSLLSGLYPAFVLSSYKPVTMLKRSRMGHTTGGSLLRKGLVAFQFASSVILIIVTFSVYKQIEYMRGKDLGINADHMLEIKLPTTPLTRNHFKNITTLKNELLKYPAVKGVTGSTAIPGTSIELSRLCWKAGTDFKNGKIHPIIFTDYDYIPTYQLELLAGRNFSKDFGTDKRSVIINEVSLKYFGFKDPESALNKDIFIWDMGNAFKVIGIIKNYHHQSLKENHEPIIMILNEFNRFYYSIKLDPKNMNETIATIKKKWDEIFPAFPFDYFFLDDHFNHQYKADQNFGRVLGVFVLLALFITCLGLLGLSYFNTVQRTKEIGIRKSFGASIADILMLLTKDIVKLVIIAAVIAWPVAYLIVDNWLKNYAFRISIPWLFFLFSGLLLFVIAVITVGYHTIVAARANPVEALREE